MNGMYKKLLMCEIIQRRYQPKQINRHTFQSTQKPNAKKRQLNRKEIARENIFIFITYI